MPANSSLDAWAAAARERIDKLAPRTIHDIWVDWDEIYGARMLGELTEYNTRTWPGSLRIMQHAAFNRQNLVIDMDQHLKSKKCFGFSTYINLCNKSTFLYDALDHNRDSIFGPVYDTWSALVGPDEFYHERGPAARLTCSANFELDKLIEQHITLCEQVEQKLGQPLSVKEQEFRWHHTNGLFSARHIHSALVPTCKAAFIIVDRWDMMVLVVLTGAIKGVHLHPDAISFDNWQEVIQERPAANCARMRLQDAIKFMWHLDRKEQLANTALAQLNSIRKRALMETFAIEASANLDRARSWGLEWDVRSRASLERILAADNDSDHQNLLVAQTCYVATQ